MAIINFTPFPNLATKRLNLRQFSTADENEIFFMRSDDDINRHTGIKKATSVEDARQFIHKINALISNNESILWGITLKDADNLIGTICLWNIEPEKNEAEIGYVLLPAFQGKGFMQEAVAKVIEYGFTVMQLRSILADLTAANTKSIQLLEKTGFVYESSLEDMVLYRLQQQ